MENLLPFAWDRRASINPPNLSKMNFWVASEGNSCEFSGEESNKEYDNTDFRTPEAVHPPSLATAPLITGHLYTELPSKFEESIHPNLLESEQPYLSRTYQHDIMFDSLPDEDVAEVSFTAAEDHQPQNVDSNTRTLSENGNCSIKSYAGHEQNPCMGVPQRTDDEMMVKMFEFLERAGISNEEISSFIFLFWTKFDDQTRIHIYKNMKLMFETDRLNLLHNFVRTLCSRSNA